MAKTDLVLVWYAWTDEVATTIGGIAGPVKVIQMPAGPGTSYKTQIGDLAPRPIQAIAQKYGVTDIGRVCLIGFSEGCFGVVETLASGDGGRVDSAYCIDGMHTQWADQKAGIMDVAMLRPWRAFGREAAGAGARRQLVVTTSAVRPPSFVDTTTCSTWVWEQVTGTSNAFAEQAMPPEFEGPVEPVFRNKAGELPGGVRYPETIYERYPLRLYRQMGGLSIVNFSNLDPTGVGDHRLQAARVTQMMLQAYLLPRWNGATDAQVTMFDEGGTGPRKLDLGAAGTAPAPSFPSVDSATGEQPLFEREDEGESSSFPTAMVLGGFVAGALATAALLSIRDEGAPSGQGEVG